MLRSCRPLRESRLGNLFRQLIQNRSGNIAMTFAVVAVPLVTAVGASFDYATAYNARLKIQTDLDAALLASVKSVGTKDADAIKTKIAAWYSAQAEIKTSLATDASDTNLSGYTLNPEDIIIDTTGHNITASVSARVPTTMLRIIGKNSIKIATKSEATGTSSNYINVYIVIDKSASMLLPTTTAGQNVMKAATGDVTNCVFACHDTSYKAYDGSTKYNSRYLYAVAKGVTLRTDVQLKAIKQVLNMVDSADAAHNRIKVGFYALGTDTQSTSITKSSYKTSKGITEVQAPIYSTTTLRSVLTSNSTLSSTTSYETTDFRALKDLATIVGTSGDGLSADNPMKLVMLVTDGVQSGLYWVANSNTTYRKYITPLNPTWCSNFKTNEATVAVLYTDYLDASGDAHYDGSLGSNMGSSYYTSAWSGTLGTGGSSTKRRDYIATSLSACASAAEYYVSANSEAEITTGFTDLFGTFLSAVRLTQ